MIRNLMKIEKPLTENKRDLELFKKLSNIKINFNHKLIIIHDFIKNKPISNKNKLFVIESNIEDLDNLLNEVLEILYTGTQNNDTLSEIQYFSNKKELVDNILIKIQNNDITAIDDFTSLID